MSEQEIQLVNELLLGATPLSAYCLGVACSMAWKDGLVPTREFLERAKACVKIEVFDAWQDAA